MIEHINRDYSRCNCADRVRDGLVRNLVRVVAVTRIRALDDHCEIERGNDTRRDPDLELLDIGQPGAERTSCDSLGIGNKWVLKPGGAEQKRVVVIVLQCVTKTRWIDQYPPHIIGCKG